MPSKGPRGNPGGVRPHSRSSSATRLGGGPNANLQFTQKEVLNATAAALAPKHAEKGKNRGPEGHKVPPQFARVNSSQRIHSKEQVALTKKQVQQSQLQNQYQQQQRQANPKAKAGFGFASQAAKDDEDDEEWVSSESGMNTPNNRHSDSEETASDSEVPHPDLIKQMDAKQIKKLQQQQQYHQQLRIEQARLIQRRELELQQQNSAQQLQNPPRRPHPVQTDFKPQVHPPLERTDTARQVDFDQTFVERGNRVTTAMQMQNAMPPPPPAQYPGQPQLTQGQIFQLQQQQQQYQKQLQYQQEMANLNYLRQQQTAQEAQHLMEQELLAQERLQQAQQSQAQHHEPPPSPPSPQTATTTSSRQSPRPKRTSRPPSTHSIISNRDSILRPHPLIRGQSYGNINPMQPPKQAPLEPLTVIPNAATPLSSSPGASGSNFPSSPGSMRASPSSPASIDLPPPQFITDSTRRTSFSSLRSVNTIPVHPTIIREGGTNGSSAYSAMSNLSNGGKPYDRVRTISTLSNLSSSSVSAAFSSLVHLPHSSTSSTLIGGATRPPSPQTVAYFPQTNPHANIEGIHPLLPGPYLSNHLTVLAKRAPIRESFERVMRAKNLNANGVGGL